MATKILACSAYLISIIFLKKLQNHSSEGLLTMKSWRVIGFIITVVLQLEAKPGTSELYQTLPLPDDHGLTEEAGEFLAYVEERSGKRRRHEIAPTDVQIKEAKKNRSAQLHILSERKRKDRIKKYIAALKQMIPNCHKNDMASILEMTVEHVQVLHFKIQMSTMERAAFVQSPPLSASHYPRRDYIHSYMPPRPWQENIGNPFPTSHLSQIGSVPPLQRPHVTPTLPANFGTESSVPIFCAAQGESSTVPTQFQQFPSQETSPTGSYLLEEIVRAQTEKRAQSPKSQDEPGCSFSPW